MNTAGRTEIEIKFLYLDALSIPSFTSQAMKRLILHIAGLLLMAACSTSPEQPAVTTIKVNADSFRTGGIDEFLDFSRCIVLQTPDSLPLGAVSTLQITEDRFLWETPAPKAPLFSTRRGDCSMSYRDRGVPQTNIRC